MAIDEKSLEAIAGSVSDGTEVNWLGAEALGESRILRNLRQVEGIAAFHRSRAAMFENSLEKTVTAAPETPPRVAPKRPGPPPLERWGHLERLEKIGEGSFGEVYRAHDPRLDRTVALKLLHLRDGDEEQKAVHEGRLLARLSQRNVATVFGVENRNRRVGLWMEYIHGRTLEDIVRNQGPFSAAEAAHIGLDLCRALSAVHRLGLVHRDIKAQNVMREEGGRIVLMDFGIGRFMDAAEGSGVRTIAGTPLYMAPEIIQGTPAGITSDIYSLGVLLFLLVTGKYPVEETTLFEILDAHDSGRVRLLRDLRQDLPAGFVQVVEKAMATNPADRFATAGQMEQALEAALNLDSRDAPPPEPEPRPSPPFWRRPAVIAPLAIGLLAAVFILSRLAIPGPYRIEAEFQRTDAAGRTEPLTTGSRVRPGDLITLDIDASRKLHVYVVNEDENGESYLLFPLRGSKFTNPLPAGRIQLPGSVGGERTGWTITSAGGKEHFMVMASPKPLTEFEGELALLQRPEPNEPVRLSNGAVRGIRGAGGVSTVPGNAGEKPEARIFEMARKLAEKPETVKGTWIRQIEVDNPPPGNEPQPPNGGPQ